MSFLHGLRHRLYVLWRGEAYAREVARELRFHLELDTLARRSDANVDPELAARRALGNETYYREEVRRMTLALWIDRIRQDARYALRGIRRSPGFAAAVVLTIGLGIGVNASMFSLLDNVFLQPPDGVARPHELRRLYVDFVNGPGSVGRFWSPRLQYPQIRAFRAALDSSVALALFSEPDSTTLRDGTARIPVRRSRINADYFSVLGVRLQAGRTFSREEDDVAVPTPVAIISDALWRRAFNASRDVIGKRIMLAATPFTIVGVAPPSFTGLDIDATDVWVPLNMTEAAGGFAGRPWYDTFGASFMIVVRVESDAAARRIADVGTNAIRPVEMPGFVYDPTIRMSAWPIIAAQGPASKAPELTVATRVAGVSLMLLLIAAANVVNLLLLRASRRRREIALRRALGVSRWRLIEQLTIESLLLSLLGGVTAVAFSAWGATALRRLVLPRVRWAESALDWRTAVFIFGVSVAFGLVAGLVPALESMKEDPGTSLRGGMRGDTPRGSRLRSSLLALQAALCVVLLVGAGLFLRSLDAVRSIDTGYEIENLYFARPTFDDPAAHAAEVRVAIPEAAKRLASIDGVEAVAYTGIPPLQGASFRTLYLPGRDSTPQVSRDFGPSMIAISPGFFRASGLRLLQGRDFTEADQASSQKVAVVGESLARAYWPGESAIGKCFMLMRRDAPCIVVVGIAADAHRRALIEGPVGQYYLPIAQTTDAPRALVLRVRARRSGDVLRATNEIFRSLVSDMNGVYMYSMATVLERELRPWRLGSTLFTALGLLAMLVAAIGVYSVVAYGVSQRTHEMGIRVALGAQARDIVDLVVRDGFRAVAVGVAIGVAGALVLGRLIASLLFGVVPNDVSVLIGASSLLCLVAIAACLIPARRAAGVDPAATLRVE